MRLTRAKIAPHAVAGGAAGTGQFLLEAFGVKMELKKSAQGAGTQLPGVLPGGRTYGGRIVHSRHFLEGLNLSEACPERKLTDALAGSVQGWSKTIHTSSKPALKWCRFLFTGRARCPYWDANRLAPLPAGGRF